jgi:predicted  nucleic acid-binding Zn-ribbon protein
MAWFRNYYRCARCGHEWTDEWSAMCDDDCSNCGARHMAPYQSEDAEGPDEQLTLSPGPPRTDIELRIALDFLKNARDRVRRLKCPRTLKKIHSAIKSAEGAARHRQLRLANGERR